MMKTVSFRARLGVHALNIALLSGTMFTAPAVAQEALPTGGQVVAGSATIATNGPTMTINQSSDTMIANWQTFSIGTNNTVTFNQPNAQSVALNRVIGQDPSQILGSLRSNGRVFLLNPNGIMIGKEGSVQTGGFIASTLGMSDADFQSGNYRFTGTGGTIVNQGDLKGGVVALIAPRVSNGGTITGDTALAGGTDVTLDFNGDGLISVEVKGSTLATLVENKGLIQADGGLAILTAKGANDALKGVVNNTGVIEAGSITSRDGRIMLLGDMDHGQVNAGGTLQAGFVETSAKDVRIADDLQVKTNGGEWLIDPNDFTIAASGGNISGATLSNNLANGNVTITTATQGTPGGNGDIHVNDTVTWSANTLTLRADRNININTAMNGSGTAGLALEYAQTDATGDYFVNAPVNLASTGSFSTKKGAGAAINYTIITSLGTQTSTNNGTLQGLAGANSGNYVLGANIDASETLNWNDGAGFKPIGNGSLTGNFDGLGHTIHNLTINRPTENKVGLFGESYYLNIRNIGLVGGNIKGQNYVGGLVGYHFAESTLFNSYNTGRVIGEFAVGGLAGGISTYSTIRNSYATGNVNGTNAVGGLVGENYVHDLATTLFVTVSNSYATGNVNGQTWIGGLVGINRRASTISSSYATGTVTGVSEVGGLVGNAQNGSLENTYATGSVNGTSDVGGLVGLSGSSVIKNSYAIGRVTGTNRLGGLVGALAGGVFGTIQNSFWDVDTTGQSSACGDSNATCVAGPSTATGLTTAQMRTAAPFIAAGWDFTNVWAIDPAINNGYPYLRATVAVAPPPPPPPPPPPVATLTVDGIAANYAVSTAPYQPTLALVGTGFADVTEVRFTWTDPNGQTGTVIWNAANNFGGGRFVVGASGTSASIAPTLIASGDPSGTYQWSVSFVAGSQTVTKSFTVAYSGVVVPPPPPPPPPFVPLSLTSGIGSTYSTGVSPYPKTFVLEGQGFAGITSITLTWTDPTGRTVTITRSAANNNFDGRFTVDPGGNTARLSTVLVDSDDPPGLYSWTITFNATGSQPVTRSFRVTYGAAPLESPVVSGVTQNPTSSLLTGGSNTAPLFVTTAPYLSGPTTALLAAISTSDISPALRALITEAIQQYGSIENFDHIAGNVPYAMLASAVYGGDLSSTNNPYANGWEDLNGEFSDLLFTASGFGASVFRNSATGEVVIAFAGTTQWQDWGTNLTLGAAQEGAALRLFDAVAARHGTVTLTGHSLGGGLAQVIASLTGSKAVTFDPAPLVSPGTRVVTGDSNIISFRNNSDPLTALFGWASSGQMTTVRNTADYPAAFPELNHSMGNLLLAMQAIALYQKTLNSSGLIR